MDSISSSTCSFSTSLYSFTCDSIVGVSDLRYTVSFSISSSLFFVLFSIFLFNSCFYPSCGWASVASLPSRFCFQKFPGTQSRWYFLLSTSPWISSILFPRLFSFSVNWFKSTMWMMWWNAISPVLVTLRLSIGFGYSSPTVTVIFRGWLPSRFSWKWESDRLCYISWKCHNEIVISQILEFF